MRNRHRTALMGSVFMLASSTGLWAVGPYMFATLGARQVSDQDMADFFALGTQQQPNFVPANVGEAYLTAGYRFTDPFALEVSGGAQMGREESNLYSFGNVDLQVPSGALSQLSIAPLFCFDTFGSVTSSWINQIGLRIEYAQISGTETIESPAGLSSLGFNGATVGWGLFYRLVNLWAPARLSVGLETGYDFLRFGTLQSGNPSGVFAGEPGHTLENLNGVGAYLDNSGPYVRLVVGWARDSSTYMVGAVRPTQTRAAYETSILTRARADGVRGDNASSLECYREYLRLRPNDGRAWNELGALYLKFSKKDFAARCFDKAAKLGCKTR